jgi:hypothetical protein
MNSPSILGFRARGTMLNASPSILGFRVRSTVFNEPVLLTLNPKILGLFIKHSTPNPNP